MAGRLTADRRHPGASTSPAGSLQINGTDAVAVTNLNLASGSSLIVTVDPNAGVIDQAERRRDGHLIGAAGAKIGVQLASATKAPPRPLTVIQAAHLTAGEPSILSLLGDRAATSMTPASPTNTTAGTVNVTVGPQERRRTAAFRSDRRPPTNSAA